jgi:predicted TIM-barrel fold metal-dependent hydrolase
MNFLKRLIAAAALLALCQPLQARERLPIIDMHLHASAVAPAAPRLGRCTPVSGYPAWDQRRPWPEVYAERMRQPPCPDPVWSAPNDEALMRSTISTMERLNIFGVLSGSAERVAAWRAAAPGRFWPGLGFQIRPESSPDTLRSLHRDGRLAVLAEVATIYDGIAPDDARLEPYWALAEELDIPVGIHVGPVFPGFSYMSNRPHYARLYSALTMEEVLIRHPRLRIYLMHAGFPFIDDLLALLYAHPQVYVDIAIINWTQPRAAFYRYLERIVEAGFADRIMFGSDQAVWPGAIERAVAVIEEAPFLTPGQKRDILYNNAARFLRLTPDEIARHHRM